MHPLDLTPLGSRLLAVNTADNRLEVFDAGGPLLTPLPPVPVGLDPVSVRARTETEAWVVNHVSDSVSVVDLRTGRVRATLPTDDEPCDVVFAGLPQRAFVTCSQANTILVFDPLHLDTEPLRIVIESEDPRALAVSPDGSTVYAAIFESGNATTIISGGGTFANAFPPEVVDETFGPYGGVNPPPNADGSFEPPQNPLNSAPPKVSLIVRRDAAGQWRDDNGENWTPWISGPEAEESGRLEGWNVTDRDVAVIDVATLGVSYVTGLMNTDMALAVRPTDGLLTVIGTDATNEIRFEPNLTGTFVRVVMAAVDATSLSWNVSDLNPHLDYTLSTLPQPQRDLSLGDPRGIRWNAAGTAAYVTGMGSNNVIVVDAGGNRTGLAPTIEVGEGPTGIALHESAARLYVLNRFEASISVVGLATETETARVAFFDPTPAAIRSGRKFLYDTHATSGLGQASCGSCHIDARTDHLAWDLGDPSGAMKTFLGQNLSGNIPILQSPELFNDFHPMKGPMLTQTLQDIIGHEPFHWRGDKDGIEEFNGAFQGLQGDDEQLTPAEMQAFEDFLATIHYPPNPYRNLDNSLKTQLPLPGHFTTGRFAPAGLPLPNGDPSRGSDLFRPPFTLDQNAACTTCHAGPAAMGTPMTYDEDSNSFVNIPLGPNGEEHQLILPGVGQTMKVPTLRALYERAGFNTTQLLSTTGFGYTNDGSIDSIERLVSISQFQPSSDQDVADLLAFIYSISGADLPTPLSGSILAPPGSSIQDAHAAVGTQVTLDSAAASPAGDVLDDLLSLANIDRIGLVAKGRVNGEDRGYMYLAANLWLTDRAGELLVDSQLRLLAGPGSEITYTAVPFGSEQRIGYDRDGDGFRDRDELDDGSNPSDPSIVPTACSLAVPDAPTGLTLTPSDVGRLELAWSDNSANEVTFVVERAPSATGAYATVTTLPAGKERFLDIGLDCGTSYDYRVAAFNCAGFSPYATATGVAPSCSALDTDVATVSLSAGGVQVLTLRAGTQYAHRSYAVLGSAFGTSPGTPLGSTLLPLNFDAYFQLMLGQANVPPFINTFNVLDASGEGTASIELPPGLDPVLTGIVFSHAFLVYDAATLTFLDASNAMPLTFVP